MRTAGLIAALLAVMRAMTEFKLFFFHEGVLVGLSLILMGVMMVRHALTGAPQRSRGMQLLFGAALTFYGITTLAISGFGVQLSTAGHIELALLLTTLPLFYYSLVELEGRAQRFGLGLCGALVLSVLALVGGIVDPRYLLTLAAIREMSIPVMLAGLGIWSVLDQRP